MTIKPTHEDGCHNHKYAQQLLDPSAKPLNLITIDLTTNIDMCPIVSTMCVVKVLLKYIVKINRF